MNPFLAGFLFVVGLGIALAAIVGVFLLVAWLWEAFECGGHWLWGVAAGAVVLGCLTLVAGGIIWVAREADKDDNPGVHEWKGGAGPSTICTYETRTEDDTRVGTGVDAKGQPVTNVVPGEKLTTYTVCRDPR